MRRLVTHTLVAVLAFSLGVAANLYAQSLTTVDETMPPATEYELAIPLPPERVCEVHGVRMDLEQVPLLRPTDEGQVPIAMNPDEVIHNFPHDGGGVATDNRDIVDGQTVSVYVCPLCRAAKAAWWKKHRAEFCTC
jgi:hypothetical protein